MLEGIAGQTAPWRCLWRPRAAVKPVVHPSRGSDRQTILHWRVGSSRVLRSLQAGTGGRFVADNRGCLLSPRLTSSRRFKRRPAGRTNYGSAALWSGRVRTLAGLLKRRNGHMRPLLAIERQENRLGVLQLQR